MGKPVILAVDDDPQVLRAVERDLRRRSLLGELGIGFQVLLVPETRCLKPEA